MNATSKLALSCAVAFAIGTVFAASTSGDVFTVVKVPIDNLGGTDASVTEMQYTIREYTLGHNRLKGVSAVEPMAIEKLPTKEGCTFGGYYTMPDGQGLLVYDEEGKMAVPFLNDFMFFLNENSVLYPWWKGKSVLKFDFNGGTSGVSQVVVETGRPLPQITVPIKEGYVFTGYRDDTRSYYDCYGRGCGVWDLTSTTLTVKAYWAVGEVGAGAKLQKQINDAEVGREFYFEASTPIVDLTEPLVIPEGKDVYLNMKGFWIGRRAMDSTPVCSGEVIRVLGKLTLRGGAVFGGSTIGNGGGILIGKKGVLRLIGGTEICANRATGAGGGIYGEKYSALFLGRDVAIVDNSASIGSDLEIPCGTMRFCTDKERAAEEASSLSPYTPGMMLLFR